MTYLVRWKQRGNLIRDGVAKTRNPPDEDMMSAEEARSYSVCGLVEILGDASKVTRVAPAVPESMDESEAEAFDGIDAEFPHENEEYPEGEGCRS